MSVIGRAVGRTVLEKGGSKLLKDLSLSLGHSSAHNLVAREEWRYQTLLRAEFINRG